MGQSLIGYLSMNSWSSCIKNEQMMLQLGADLASCFSDQHGLISFYGDLGAGKSTMIRGFIKACGYQGHVKSPTYTLMEPYSVADKTFFHLDLYRLEDPQELEFIGIRDLFDDNAVTLVEWPEKGAGVLPEPVIKVEIEHLDSGRQVRITAVAPAAASIINELTEIYN